MSGSIRAPCRPDSTSAANGPSGARSGDLLVCWRLRGRTLVAPPVRSSESCTVTPDPDAQVPALMPLVYEELRRIAARYMRQERPGQTLQPTALVNEAFLRLAGDGRTRFAGKTHFVAIAAIAMRRILVERARARRALKRGGGPARVTLDEGLLAHTGRPIDVIALDEALQRLEALDPEQVRIVELRYFGGLTVEETAAAIGVSPATVKRQWTVARAWLKRALDAIPADPAPGPS